MSKEKGKTYILNYQLLHTIEISWNPTSRLSVGAYDLGTLFAKIQA